MKIFYISDQVEAGEYDVVWHPGQENLADYQSKHHTSAHHRAVRPWYLHMQSSPLTLPRALAPSALRGDSIGWVTVLIVTSVVECIYEALLFEPFVWHILWWHVGFLTEHQVSLWLFFTIQHLSIYVYRHEDDYISRSGLHGLSILCREAWCFSNVSLHTCVVCQTTLRFNLSSFTCFV